MFRPPDVASGDDPTSLIQAGAACRDADSPSNYSAQRQVLAKQIGLGRKPAPPPPPEPGPKPRRGARPGSDHGFGPSRSFVAMPIRSAISTPVVLTWLPAIGGKFETVVGNGREIGPAIGRAVIGVPRPDHDLGKVRAIGGHDAICHKAPEAVGIDHRADDVLAKGSERGHVLCRGSAWLVCLRRMQGVNANTMPINDERVAIDRCGLTFNDGRLLRLAGLR